MIPPNPRSDELDQRKSRVVRIDPFEMPLEPFSRGIFLAKSFVFGGDDPQNDRLERENLLVNSRGMQTLNALFGVAYDRKHLKSRPSFGQLLGNLKTSTETPLSSASGTHGQYFDHAGKRTRC